MKSILKVSYKGVWKTQLGNRKQPWVLKRRGHRRPSGQHWPHNRRPCFPFMHTTWLCREGKKINSHGEERAPTSKRPHSRRVQNWGRHNSQGEGREGGRERRREGEGEMSEWPKQKTMTIANAGWDSERLDLSYLTDENVRWHSHSGK